MLRDGAVTFSVPAGALSQDRRLYMRSALNEEPAAAKGVGELVPLGEIEIYPANLTLKRAATLVAGPFGRDVGLYRQGAGDAQYLGPAATPLPLARLGAFRLLRDVKAPVFSFDLEQLQEAGRVAIHLRDQGSGVDPASLSLLIGGGKVEGQLEGDWYRATPDAGLAAGQYQLSFTASDRAGNTAVLRQSFAHRGPALPDRPLLQANYPNPFNSETVISFSLPAFAAAEATARLVVYNLAGQPVRQLFQRQAPWAGGEHRVTWDGLDGAGRPVASGIYLYRLESGQGAETRRMTLLK